jgi:hypothetical protein
MAPPLRPFWSPPGGDITFSIKEFVSIPAKEGIMDKRFQRTVDLLNVFRFGIAMAAEAQRVEHMGGDALAKAFERARPMLAPRRR